MRAISRDFIRDGEAMFQKFHQHDKRRHAWYYRSCTAGLKGELGDTPAWQELDELVGQVFDGSKPAPDEQSRKQRNLGAYAV